MSHTAGNHVRLLVITDIFFKNRLMDFLWGKIRGESFKGILICKELFFSHLIMIEFLWFSKKMVL